MKNLLRFLAIVLMVGSVCAQSNLPACAGHDVSKWSNCAATQILSNGHKYIGDFQRGRFNGQGAYYSPNGRVISEGLWVDDKLVSSVNTYAQSNLPRCLSSVNRHNCFDSVTYVNGDKYVGEFKDGKANGLGTSYASNGSIINQGIWAGNVFVRSAPVQQASAINQTVATATQQANIPQSNLPACQGSNPSWWSNCVGSIAGSDGGTYVGEWKDGKRNGQGTITYPYGGKYVGEWKDQQRHGQGTFIYANGDKYFGEWKGVRHGQGTLYASNGSIISQGIWADGNFVRTAPVQQAISPSAQTNNAERDRLTAEVETERKKRQELEQQLASNNERERITSELDLERKKRQELEAQLAASVQPTQPQTNAPRRIAHALVIGNAAYPGSGRLDNPVNDANAISQKLRSMGFIVTTVTDANRQRLVQSMAQFRRTAASADISLLYYAGHSVQIFGTNYILPTDVDQTDPAQATIQGVSLNSVVENFLPGKTKLVFLDACRDNALQRTSDRSVSKGLAPISVAEGTLISYATKDGQTAADGVGKNSPFTQALLEHINDPQDIAVVLRKVRERVMKITGGKQQPWEYGSLTGGELVLSAIKPK